jgi:lipopolysaccharide transport system permease protein
MGPDGARGVLTSQRGLGSRSWSRRRPRSGWVAIDFRELWRYRELLVFFASRDLKVRYKQTVLGAAWAILQPVLTMAAFSIIFGRLARIPSGHVPYPIFVFCALLPWQLFAYALVHSSNSLVENAQTIRRSISRD